MQVFLGKSAEQMLVSELKTKVKLICLIAKEQSTCNTHLEFCVCCATQTRPVLFCVGGECFWVSFKMATE